tara:strand:- start:687 stop:1007 length:321 start_codon:yes stop_codon:yes gene_type:complete
MIKFFKILFLIILLANTYSCSSVKEGFSNQKKNNSDEFLVKKKSPLVLPPNFNELPKPKDNEHNLNKEKNKIKELVTSSNKNKSNDTKKNISKDFKTILLENIKNN